MGKSFDALYGEISDDPMAGQVEPKIKEGEDPKRIAAILKSRAEGYFNRASQFKKEGQQANQEAAMGTCRELAYLARMIEEQKLAELEAAGK